MDDYNSREVAQKAEAKSEIGNEEEHCRTTNQHLERWAPLIVIFNVFAFAFVREQLFTVGEIGTVAALADAAYALFGRLSLHANSARLRRIRHLEMELAEIEGREAPPDARFPRISQVAVAVSVAVATMAMILWIIAIAVAIQRCP